MSTTSLPSLTRRRFLQAGGAAAAWLLIPVPSSALASPASDTATRGDFGPDTRRLPAWFDGNRVQGTTRLNRRVWYDSPEFTQAAAGFKALGAAAFTRHVKSGDEDPWPRDDIEQIINEAHREGLKIIAYYWHMSEKTLSDSNPEWVCKHPNGTDIVEKRGVRLDITGPYREVVLERLLDLAAMGADGFMFDSEHLPGEGCWGCPLEEAWVAETGQPRAPTPDEEDYLEYIDFKARKIEATFAYWRQRVRARHPQVVFVISTTTIPALTSRQMTTRLARIADSPKSEYRLAVSRALNHHVFEGEEALWPPSEHVRMALGWTVLRDSAGGRAPKIWVSGVPDRAHALAAAGSLMTFGGVANMDVYEDSLIGGQSQPEGKTPLAALAASFKLGNVVSPHLAGTKPVRWAAVHFSERTRNKRGATYRLAWEEVLWPLVGAYQVLSEDGLPVGVVTDDQLEAGDLTGYQVLVLPNPGELSSGQQQVVSAFAARGGKVINNLPAWGWSDESRNAEAMAAFRSAIQPHVRTAPVRVTGGPAGRYGVSYRTDGRLVVAVTNDFSWVQITNAQPDFEYPDPVHLPPPPARGVRVTWQGSVLSSGLTELLHPWQAVEAISGTKLTVLPVLRGWTVVLPPFPHMALLVVTRAE